MKKYGLIGKSLGHSFSPAFFKAYFEEHQIEASYELIPLEDIKPIESILSKAYNGLNVTIPYKEDIIPFLNELSPEAKTIGAVNTIVFRNGKSIGFNTDAFGFQQSIKPFLTFEHERALILGTGGSSKAVAHVLKHLGFKLIF